MSVLDVEKVVSQFTHNELAEFRQWFEEFDAEMWDKEIEADVAAGRFDSILDEVRQEIKAGRVEPL